MYPDQFIMIIGGSNHCKTNTQVSLISLDPSNPVPSCLESLAPFPTSIQEHAGATLGSGLYGLVPYQITGLTTVSLEFFDTRAKWLPRIFWIWLLIWSYQYVKIMPQVIKIIMFFKICLICFRKGPIHLWGTRKSWVLSLPAHQRYMGSVGYFGILTQTSWIYLSQRAGTCYQWRYWWEWDKQSWAHTWWPDNSGTCMKMDICYAYLSHWEKILYLFWVKQP